MQQVKAVFASGEFTFFANKVGKFMQNHARANFNKFIYGFILQIYKICRQISYKNGAWNEILKTTALKSLRIFVRKN